MLVVVSAPVLKVPVVPVPPPPDEVHEVLLFDDQLMVVPELYGTEVDTAETDTVTAVGEGATSTVILALAC